MSHTGLFVLFTIVMAACYTKSLQNPLYYSKHRRVCIEARANIHFPSLAIAEEREEDGHLLEATSDDFFTGISPTTYGSDLQPNLLLVCGPGLSPLIDLSLDLFPPMSAFAVYAALEPSPQSSRVSMEDLEF
jgi:hypothetical protein